MPFQPTSEQRGFCSTFDEFLSQRVPPSVLRELTMDGPSLDRDLWRQLAELGWTTLLVPEEKGGGSLTDQPLVDLALVAEVSGRRLAPGPFIPANVVTTALAVTPGNGVDEVLSGVIEGSLVPAWALAEGRGTFRPRDIRTSAARTGAGFVLDGTKRFVEAAPDADVLLVAARQGDGLAHFLVRRDQEGVAVQPQHGLEPSRSYGTVTLDAVEVPAEMRVGPATEGEQELQRLLDSAVALQSAESLGLMNHVWDFTLEWVQNRVAFGRVIGSYQALKHRLADHKLWLEASEGLVEGLVRALANGDADGSRIAAITKAHIGDTAVNLVSDSVQLHGGIGVTWEHDLHLYLRRATANRAMYGSPIEHREHLCVRAGI